MMMMIILTYYVYKTPHNNNNLIIIIIPRLVQWFTNKFTFVPGNFSSWGHWLVAIPACFNSVFNPPDIYYYRFINNCNHSNDNHNNNIHVVLRCLCNEKERTSHHYELTTYWKLLVNHAASSACCLSLVMADDSAMTASSLDILETFICHIMQQQCYICNNSMR